MAEWLWRQAYNALPKRTGGQGRRWETRLPEAEARKTCVFFKSNVEKISEEIITNAFRVDLSGQNTGRPISASVLSPLILMANDENGGLWSGDRLFLRRVYAT